MANFLINELSTALVRIIYIVPILLISFPFHELAHGVTAYWLGDDTAKNQGRLTLNPIKHLDLFGTILIILTGFGWAKPVPVNPLNFRKRKEGMALTAIAGPVANLILAFIALLILHILSAVFSLPDAVGTFLYLLAYINIGLAIFNLIPINPLDGSRILAMILPEKIEFALYRYEGYLQVALFLLIFFTNFLTGPLNYLVNNVYHNFQSIINLIPV